MRWRELLPELHSKYHMPLGKLLPRRFRKLGGMPKWCLLPYQRILLLNVCCCGKLHVDLGWHERNELCLPVQRGLLRQCAGLNSVCGVCCG